MPLSSSERGLCNDFMLRVHKKKSSIEMRCTSGYVCTHALEAPIDSTWASWTNSLRNFQKKSSQHSFQGLSTSLGGDSLFFGDEFKKRNFQILKFLQRALTDDIKWNWKYDSEKVTNIVIIQIRHTLFNALSYSTRKLSLRKWKWIQHKNWVNERYQGFWYRLQNSIFFR